jgi:charged multivesicular body protein 7
VQQDQFMILGGFLREGVLSAIISSASGHKDTTWWGHYVVVPLVEKAAQDVLSKQEKRMAGMTDRLYSLDGFRNEFGSVLNIDTPLSEKDALVLLKFLERDRGVLLFDQGVCLLPTGPPFPLSHYTLGR